MRTTLWLSLALLAAAAIALSLQSADAHYSVPRYDGVAWGLACSQSGGGRTLAPPACCNHAQVTCTAACALVDANDGWKNECRARCQAAGAACLQRVTPRPPEGLDPRKPPPATTN